MRRKSKRDADAMRRDHNNPTHYRWIALREEVSVTVTWVAAGLFVFVMADELFLSVLGTTWGGTGATPGRVYLVVALMLAVGGVLISGGVGDAKAARVREANDLHLKQLDAEAAAASPLPVDEKLEAEKKKTERKGSHQKALDDWEAHQDGNS